MKLKLSSSEFLVLHTLLQQVVMGVLPQGIQQQVLHGVLFQLYKKFYKKAIETKNRYTITMEPMEACAFQMYFSKHSMEGVEVFTINLVHQINNSIHQKYSV
jgi:hypothetical protein